MLYHIQIQIIILKYQKKLLKNLSKSNKNGVLWSNQFDNICNLEAHIQTTAKEIWTQTAGQVHGFICSVGTGGTLAGYQLD